MIVLILEKVPASLRGDLTRWLLELKTGVFVGDVSAIVREKLWEKVCSGCKGGSGMLLNSASNEQGFDIRFWGKTSRLVSEYEGIKLITVVAKETSAIDSKNIETSEQVSDSELLL
jgi:CRISPR-associated protein Cas2